VLLDDIKWKSNHPLYILMSHQDWEGAYDLLEEHPEQANKWQYGIEMDEANEPQLWKRLPVHHACRFGAPVGLLSILLRTGPVSPEDPYTGCLPIHLTCRYAPSMDTIQALLYSEPSCAKRTDSNGRLALHLACIKGAPTDVVQKLVTAYPASVAVKDKSGKTPLDYCSESIDAEVLKIMKRLQAFLGRVEVRKRKENSKKTVEKVSADTKNDAPESDLNL
jgi:ankyrin repeat protein